MTMMEAAYAEAIRHQKPKDTTPRRRQMAGPGKVQVTGRKTLFMATTDYVVHDQDTGAWCGTHLFRYPVSVPDLKI